MPRHLLHAPLFKSPDKMYILPQRMHSSCGSPAISNTTLMNKNEIKKLKRNKKKRKNINIKCVHDNIVACRKTAKENEPHADDDDGKKSFCI